MGTWAMKRKLVPIRVQNLRMKENNIVTSPILVLYRGSMWAICTYPELIISDTLGSNIHTLNSPNIP